MIKIYSEIILTFCLISLSFASVIAQSDSLSAIQVDAINSNFDDINPLFIDSSTMLFTSSKGNIRAEKANNFSQDIYVSKKEENTWQKPEYWLKSFNSGNHDAIVGISNDRNIIYIYKHFNGGDIYYTKKNQNQKWSILKKLPINTEFHERAAFRYDSTLYLVSNFLKGNEQHDIFKFTISKNGNYSNPKPIDILNSEFDEASVFVNNNGRLIYFSSNRENNIYNIYKSEIDAEGNFSEPVKLESPVSSKCNEISYSEDLEGNIYISSDRDSTLKNGFQIYKIDAATTKKETIVKDVPIVLNGKSELETNNIAQIIQIKYSVKVEGLESDIPNEIIIEKNQLKDSTTSYSVKDLIINSSCKILDSSADSIFRIKLIEKIVSEIPKTEFNSISEAKSAIDFDINYCRIQVGAFYNIVSISEFESKYPKLKGKVMMEDTPNIKKFYLKEKIKKIEDASVVQKKCILEYSSVKDTFIGVYDNDNERILIFFDVEKNKYIMLKK